MAKIKLKRSSRAVATQQDVGPHVNALEINSQPLQSNDYFTETNKINSDNKSISGISNNILGTTSHTVNNNQPQPPTNDELRQKQFAGVSNESKSNKEDSSKKQRRSAWRFFYLHPSSSSKKPQTTPVSHPSTDATSSSTTTHTESTNKTKTRSTLWRGKEQRSKKREKVLKQETASRPRIFSSRSSASSQGQKNRSDISTITTNTNNYSNKPRIITNSNNKQVILTPLPPYEIEVTESAGSIYIECPLCVLIVNYSATPNLRTCSHRTCLECMQRYLKTEINHSRLKITCPICPEPLQQQVIREVLQDNKCYSKYESFMLRKVLAADPDARWCPAPDCGYAVLATGCASCPRLLCGRDGCNTEFCYHCKQEWHPNQTCSAASIQRNKRSGFLINTFNISELVSAADETQQASGNYLDAIDDHDVVVIVDDVKADKSTKRGDGRKSSRSSQQAAAASSLRPEDIKECPVCSSRIIKMNDGSCNHMTCSICETDFCWLCMKEITDLHYFSPSGCTFWGKKPWSRKKKLLWRLGMLVGAPICIVFVAGIAVPAIVIGIPVWAARKLHARLEKKEFSRYRKNAIITGGVLLSFVVSPIISIMALAVGIPLLLGYVYGVVPLSLCRSSGGCLSANPSVDDLPQAPHQQLNSQQQAASAKTSSASSASNQARNFELQRLHIEAARQLYFKRQQMQTEQQPQKTRHNRRTQATSSADYTSQTTPPPYSDVISVGRATNSSKPEVSFVDGGRDNIRQHGGGAGSSIGEPSMYMSNISLETNSIGTVTNIIDRSSRHSASGTGGCDISSTGCEVEDRESASNVVLTGSITGRKLDADAQSTRALAGSIVSKESGGYTLVPAEVYTTNNNQQKTRPGQQHSHSLSEDSHQQHNTKTRKMSSLSAYQTSASFTPRHQDDQISRSSSSSSNHISEKANLSNDNLGSNTLKSTSSYRRDSNKEYRMEEITGMS